MYMETKAALLDAESAYCHFSAIGGLGGTDISIDMMMKSIRTLEEHKHEPGEMETQWYMAG